MILNIILLRQTEWQTNTNADWGGRTSDNHETHKQCIWSGALLALVFKAKTPENMIKQKACLTQSPTENMVTSQQVWGRLPSNASTDKWISHWVTPKSIAALLPCNNYPAWRVKDHIPEHCTYLWKRKHNEWTSTGCLCDDSDKLWVYWTIRRFPCCFGYP